MKCEFVDASAMARKSPATFERPNEGELEALVPGDLVKVCAQSERFWVKLIKVDGDSLEGVVDNDLLRTEDHGLDFGHEIEIKLDHVYAIF